MTEGRVGLDAAGGRIGRATHKRRTLRAGLAADTVVVAVGAHDALTAKLIGLRAFDAVWVSGLGVTTAQLGLADLNLMSFSEALEAAVRIDRATDLPVIADCDNGYGGFLNVVRTAREYELAGIAGILHRGQRVSQTQQPAGR